MAIVKMKKVRVLGIGSEKDALLDKLLAMGCLEVSESEINASEETEGLLAPVTETNIESFREKNELLSEALKTVKTYAPSKSALFPELKPMRAKDFFDEDYLEKTVFAARKVSELTEELTETQATISSQKLVAAMLEPWKRLDIPLEMTGTKSTKVTLFTVPSFVNCEELEAAVQNASELTQLEKLGDDREQSYYAAIVHKDDAEKVSDELRRFGCGEPDFSDYTGTVTDNIVGALHTVHELTEKEAEIKKQIAGYARFKSDFETCIDRTAQEISREEAKSRLAEIGMVYSLEGWAPASSEDELKKLFDGMTCAYEFSDPAPEDDVPVKLKNSKIVEPLNMVTELYSLPSYYNIDPNPLIFPWFTLFFGIMYADLGYGLVLLALGLAGVKLIKQKGTLKYMAGLLVLCGVTTSICGILFGSFFGDAIPVFCDLIGIEHHELWSLIDPMEEPMTALIGSVVIGAVHLLLGMAIKAYLLIRDGHPLDALFDIGSWWVLFAGIGLGALGKGWVVAIIGAAMLVLTQGREKPTIIGKLVGGLASLYDITSYIGDILSYTRLMALMLAGSVIASVVNVLGSMGGSVIVFIIVCVIGHAFNMAINIIGTFVHAARLQYLEFFGKFYEEGGRPFRPLSYKTKYTDIVKEEK